MSNEEITIGQLADIVKEGFEQLSSEIKDLNEKVDALDRADDEEKDGIRDIKEKLGGLERDVELGFKEVGNDINDIKR